MSDTHPAETIANATFARLDLAAVRFPSRAEMECGYLVVRMVGDDERRGRLVGKHADGAGLYPEFLHPCAVADEIRADRTDDVRLLTEQRQAVRDVACGAAELFRRGPRPESSR